VMLVLRWQCWNHSWGYNEVYCWWQCLGQCWTNAGGIAREGVNARMSVLGRQRRNLLPKNTGRKEWPPTADLLVKVMFTEAIMQSIMLPETKWH
jgi:hypothetical protein